MNERKGERKKGVFDCECLTDFATGCSDVLLSLDGQSVLVRLEITPDCFTINFTQ